MFTATLLKCVKTLIIIMKAFFFSFFRCKCLTTKYTLFFATVRDALTTDLVTCQRKFVKIWQFIVTLQQGNILNN